MTCGHTHFEADLQQREYDIADPEAKLRIALQQRSVARTAAVKLRAKLRAARQERDAALAAAAALREELRVAFQERDQARSAAAALQQALERVLWGPSDRAKGEPREV